MVFLLSNKKPVLHVALHCTVFYCPNDEQTSSLTSVLFGTWKPFKKDLDKSSRKKYILWNVVSAP